ncbi:MAG: hypothetical protein NVSMB2_01990 [Chloroflexota bacterium]
MSTASPPSPILWHQSDRPLVSIIILTYNQLEYTRLCVDSVLRHTHIPYELIFIDNASTDGTIDYLRTLPDVKIVANAHNLGYAAGNNQGLALARGAFVLLLNNDAIVTDGWLERLVASMRRDPRVGIAGPRSNYVAGAQLVPEVPYRSLADLDGYAAQRALGFGESGSYASTIVGFCMLVRRELIERIGGLDPVFGSGNFEDTDYCVRALLAGYICWIADGAFVHHYGHRTFIGAKIDWRASMKRNGKIFAEKWGLPLEGEMLAAFDLPGVLSRTRFDAQRDFCPLPAELSYVTVTPALAAYHRGVQLLQAGQVGDAIEVLAQAVKISPDVADFHNALGAAFCEAGMLDQAVAALLGAAQLLPESHDIQANLAEVRELQQRAQIARSAA